MGQDFSGGCAGGAESILQEHAWFNHNINHVPAQKGLQKEPPLFALEGDAPPVGCAKCDFASFALSSPRR